MEIDTYKCSDEGKCPPGFTGKFICDCDDVVDWDYQINGRVTTEEKLKKHLRYRNTTLGKLIWKEK